MQKICCQRYAEEVDAGNNFCTEHSFDCATLGWAILSKLDKDGMKFYKVELLSNSHRRFTLDLQFYTYSDAVNYILDIENNSIIGCNFKVS